MSEAPERRWRDDPEAPAAVRRALQAKVPEMPDAVRAAVLASLAPPPVAPAAAAAKLSPLTIGAAAVGVAAVVVALVVLLGRDRTTPAPTVAPSATASAPVSATASASASATASASASASASATATATATATASASATATATATASASARPRASASEVDTLAEETALIGRARERLASDPAAALGAVDAHASKFPNGTLASEREYVRISALRRLGRVDEAKAHAQRYVTRFPSSPQVPAVRRFLEEGK